MKVQTVCSAEKKSVKFSSQSTCQMIDFAVVYYIQKEKNAFSKLYDDAYNTCREY